MKDDASRDSVAAIRGRSISLTVLELFGTDLTELNRKLEAKAAQAPDFFHNAPLLLDFDHIKEDVGAAWLANLYRILIANQFLPAGITGASELLQEAAAAQQIPVWPTGRITRQMTAEWEREPNHHPTPPEELKAETAQNERDPSAESAPQADEADEAEDDPNPVSKETMVIHKPVRSGQKIYAQGADLIVLASVNTGAEILADGNVHVYGSLRGRVIAGAQGKKSARIFCKDLQADLVAIAGLYLTNEDLPEDKRNQAVQIYLKGEHLLIDLL